MKQDEEGVDNVCLCCRITHILHSGRHGVVPDVRR